MGALGQYVQQEAPDDLVGMKSHRLPAPLAVGAAVLPAERDAGVVGRNEAARRLPTRVGRGEETGFQVEQRNRDEGSGECRQIVLDFESLIQGLLGVHSRYGLHTRAVTNS